MNNGFETLLLIIAIPFLIMTTIFLVAIVINGVELPSLDIIIMTVAISIYYLLTKDKKPPQ